MDPGPRDEDRLAALRALDLLAGQLRLHLQPLAAPRTRDRNRRRGRAGLGRGVGGRLPGAPAPAQVQPRPHTGRREQQDEDPSHRPPAPAPGLLWGGRVVRHGAYVPEADVEVLAREEVLTFAPAAAAG